MSYLSWIRDDFFHDVFYETLMHQPLLESQVEQKIKAIQESLTRALDQPGQFVIPKRAVREIPVLIPGQLPAKKGLSQKEGQSRLLHDLASIELQAMELCFRTLVEYPDAPTAFRQELKQITLSESQHLDLCLKGLKELDSFWGAWACHTSLWDSVSSQDTLLERIFIVHRYLEGSGLDSGDTLLKRLRGVPKSPLHQIVQIINAEEVEHVQFGSRWFHYLCEQENKDPVLLTQQLLKKYQMIVPKRLEKISVELRKKSGFLDQEIQALEEYRERMISKNQPVMRSSLS